MSFCGFSLFPQDLLGFLARYLLPEDGNDGYQFKFVLELRNLVNSNRKYFSEWKKQSQILPLNRKYSLLFVQSKSFHEHVERSVTTLKQLQISLDMDDAVYIDLTQLHGVQKISFINWTLPFAPVLIDVDHITLEGDIQDLNFCANVRKVELRHCPRDYRRLSAVIDLGCLPNVEDLTCDVREVQNYMKLEHLMKATFRSCRSIKDVSCFRNLHTLVLNYCGNVTDVSSLGNLYHLDLTGCEEVIDVSALSKVHTLILTSCNEIRDVSSLVNVHQLDLNSCFAVRDIPRLESVNSLDLSGYAGTDLSSLVNVTVLNLFHSRAVSDLSCLRESSVRNLTIAKCPKICDITMLHHVETLNISHSLNIKNFEGLTSLKQLTMETYEDGFEILSGMETFSQLRQLIVGRIAVPCRGSFESALKENQNLDLQLDYSDVSVERFRHLRKLKITNSPFLTQISPFLLSLQTLILYECSSLQFLLVELPKLTELQIFYCNNLKSLQLSGPANTPRLYRLEIVDCRGLEELQLYRQVFHLKIKKCLLLRRIQTSSEVGNFDSRDSDSVQVDYCSQD
jgi:hypothetical protein